MWTFPARGTWIEILIKNVIERDAIDVPRKGNVDRNNFAYTRMARLQKDVPRKGNVDRNLAAVDELEASVDVPRKGNVDRNIAWRISSIVCLKTFPARGTWIEI